MSLWPLIGGVARPGVSVHLGECPPVLAQCCCPEVPGVPVGDWCPVHGESLERRPEASTTLLRDTLAQRPVRNQRLETARRRAQWVRNARTPRTPIQRQGATWAQVGWVALGVVLVLGGMAILSG